MNIENHELERVVESLERNKLKKDEIPEFKQYDIAIKGMPCSDSGLSGDIVDIYDYASQYSLSELAGRYADELSDLLLHRNSLVNEPHLSKTLDFFNNRIMSTQRALKQLQLGRHRIGVLIADAVGHDLASAITATKVKNIIRSFVAADIESYGQITGRALNRANTRLFKANLRHTTGKFKRNRETASLIFGDLYENRFSFISLAHPQPLFYSYEYNEFLMEAEELRQPSRVFRLGEFPSIDCFEKFPEPLIHAEKYAAKRIDFFSPGVLFLYTDGLEELAEPVNFIESSVKPIFAESKDKSAYEIGKLIESEVRSYLESRSLDQDDDISFIIIKRNPIE